MPSEPPPRAVAPPRTPSADRALSLFPRDTRAPAAANAPELLPALALALLPGVGPVRWQALVEGAEGDADRALARATPPHARAIALADAGRALDRAGRAGIRPVVLGATAYPAALLDLPDPPPVLWQLGDPSLLDRAPRVAVVGTRSATPYGLRAARALCDALAAAGACIVSGMARGVDGVAHERALEAGAPTVAVLGTGADVPFPTDHRALHRELARRALLVSEQPPGARATRGTFPRRNRIIAALADLTIVVEAGVRSGALITAGVALDLGRPVAALPGPVDAPASVGCNALLRDGAHVIASPADALVLLGLARSARPAATADGPLPAILQALGDDAGAVWRALAAPAPDADALVARTGLPPDRCAVAVATLEIHALVESTTLGELHRR